MKELVTANGQIFECESVRTEIDGIEFTMKNQDAADMDSFFRGVTELTTSYDGEEKPHGTFKNLAPNGVVINPDSTVTVKMRMKTETEIRLDALEESQKKQDETISVISSVSGISI